MCQYRSRGDQTQARTSASRLCQDSLDFLTQIIPSAETELTLPAGDAGLDRDAVADLKLRDGRADLDDLPGGLVAENDVVCNAYVANPAGLPALC